MKRAGFSVTKSQLPAVPPSASTFDSVGEIKKGADKKREEWESGEEKVETAEMVRQGCASGKGLRPFRHAL